MSGEPRGAESSLAKIAVALDTADWQEFVDWCAFFGPRVGTLKIGLEAFLRWGSRAVEEALGSTESIFLDLKLHDIPNTVAGAVRSVRALGVRYLTVHAGGGPAMLEAAVAESEGEIELLAVTLLTHLDVAALEALDLPGSAEERVSRWGALAAACGVPGAVCSPREVTQLRAERPRPFRLVTPGIRLATDAANDQRRVATPDRALEDGADLLVVGRPLTRAADREAALAAFAEAIERAMG